MDYLLPWGDDVMNAGLTIIYRLAKRSGTLAQGVFLAMAVSVSFSGCSSRKAEGNSGRPQQMVPSVPVIVAEAERKTVPVEVHAIGTVEAFSTVTVKSQVEGQIDSVHFTQGQEVKAGDLLFMIDPRPFQAQLDQAQANLARDEAQAKNASAQAARYASLFQAGIVSKDQFDQFQTTADALGAAVRADKAAVETAKLNLGYCTIKSPIDGRTGDLLVHPGNLVKSNDTALLVINRLSPIYVDFSVPEQYLADVKRFMAERRLEVRAAIGGDQAHPARGVLTFINNTVDSSTGTILLKGEFPNGDRRLWPGQFVDVYLTLASQRDATVVPSQALQRSEKGQYVYVIKPDMTTEFRLVEVGNSYEGDTVIEKGLAPGEKVVTDGQLLLFPGAHVTIKPGLATNQGGTS